MCVYFVCFFVLFFVMYKYMFPKKMIKSMGWCVLANPIFSPLFGFFLTWQDPWVSIPLWFIIIFMNAFEWSYVFFCAFSHHQWLLAVLLLCILLLLHQLVQELLRQLSWYLQLLQLEVPHIRVQSEVILRTGGVALTTRGTRFCNTRGRRTSIKLVNYSLCCCKLFNKE